MEKVTEADILTIKKFIAKYNSYKRKNWKAKARNEIFNILNPCMQIWIKSILSKWNFIRTKEEILSYAFGSVELCLNNYKSCKSIESMTIPQYFYSGTRYYLLQELAKETSVHMKTEELLETLLFVPSDINVAFSSLLVLAEIRETLPNWCKVIYDDAAATVINSKPIASKHGLSSNTYYKVKQSLIPVIRFLIKKQLS